MKLEPTHIRREEFDRYVETDQAIIGLRRDKILHVYFKTNTVIDKNFQHWLLIVYNYVTEGTKYPFVVEGGEFVDIARDGKRYAEEIFHEIPVVCEAIVVKNTAQLIIASFFIRFSKLKMEIKIFKDFNKAITWCSEHAVVSKTETT